MKPAAPLPERAVRRRTASGLAVAASLLVHAALLVLAGSWYASPPSAPIPTERRSDPIQYVTLVAPAALPERVPTEAPATTEEQRVEEEEEEEEEEEDPKPAEARNPVPAAAPASAPFRPGFSDSRLYIDASTRRLRAAPARPSAGARFEGRVRAEDVANARRAQADSEKRQVTIFGRKIPVLGDSAAATWRTPTAVVGGKRMVMPTDGREWEEGEMTRQRREFVEDSILRERNRAMPERRRD